MSLLVLCALAALALATGQDEAFSGPSTLEARGFTRIPGYTGPLEVNGRVWAARARWPLLRATALSWQLAGVDPACGGALTRRFDGDIANACGVHIHEGRSCASVQAIGHHLWNQTALQMDPWEPIKYISTPDGKAMAAGIVVPTWLRWGELPGRPVVVHDSRGNMVACALVQPLTRRP